MKERVVHLANMSGQNICGGLGQANVQHWNNLVDGERKCLRCVRKTLRLPIDRAVPKGLR